MRAINIIWDVDCPEEMQTLPAEIEIPPEIAQTNDEEMISDYLSDTTGFCHKGFQLTTD
jgi:hypothetical protein